MKLSTRLTRAGVAFVIFGMVASVLPTNSAVLAAPGYPPTPGNSRNNTGRDILVGTAALAALYFAFQAGGFHSAKPKGKLTPAEIEAARIEQLDRFARPSDGASNPAINH